MTRQIATVTRQDCSCFVMQVHYARRWPSITYAFGLFKNGELEGICTYGTPPSAPLRSGIAGKEYAKNILELNRLALRCNERNDASWLVSASLRELKKIGRFIVVSFADAAQGHVGTVYQAAGFSYHGLSAKRTDWKIRGQEHLHGQTIADRYRGHVDRAKAIRAEWGDSFYLHPRPRKHRYIRVIGCKKWSRNAILALRYPQEPYPKKATA